MSRFAHIFALFACMAFARQAHAILGGKEVSAKDSLQKSVVGLILQDPQSEEPYYCSGSLLAKDIIITAAHCVSGATHILIAFDRAILSAPSAHLREANPRLDTVIHSSYVEGNQNAQDEDPNDVALIRFSGGVPEGFQPARILDSRIDLEQAQNLMIAGYGSDNSFDVSNTHGKLRKAELPILRPNPRPKNIVLQGDEENSAFFGDSGGPAYVQKGSDYFLVGVLGIINEVEYKNYYENLFNYSAWINASIKLLRRR